MTIIFTKCDKRKKKKNGGKRPEENVSDFQELISGFFQTTPPWIMTSSVTHQGRDEILLHMAQLRNYWLKHWKNILQPHLLESTRYNALFVMLVLAIHKNLRLSKILIVFHLFLEWFLKTYSRTKSQSYDFELFTIKINSKWKCFSSKTLLNAIWIAWSWLEMKMCWLNMNLE